MRRRLVAMLSLTLAGLVVGCRPGENVASELLTDPTHDAALGEQPRCNVVGSAANPLVVEWPAAARASLEARVRKGLVAVRYEGCDLEVLRQCRAPGHYEYHPVSLKTESVRIDNLDELYAELPVGAAELEGRLEKAAALQIEMNIVGMFQTTRGDVYRGELEGDCEGATHVIDGFQVGAYRFFSDQDAAVGAKASVAGHGGAGAQSTAGQELLSQDGDGLACQAGGEGSPPVDCKAMIRIEVVPIAEGAAPDRVAAECPAGKRLEGGKCVSATEVAAAPLRCPMTTHVEKGRGCVPDAPPSGQLYGELSRPLEQARASIQGGNRKKAETLLRKVISVYDSRTYPEGDGAAAFAAEAQFLLGEYLAADAMAAEMKSVKVNKIQSEVKRLTDLTVKASSAYDKVARFQQMEWSLAASYRKGFLRENFAAKLRAAPVPPSLRDNPEAEDTYLAIIDEYVMQLEMGAIQAYEQILAAAERDHLASGWVDKTRRRMEMLRPEPRAVGEACGERVPCADGGVCDQGTCRQQCTPGGTECGAAASCHVLIDPMPESDFPGVGACRGRK